MSARIRGTGRGEYLFIHLPADLAHEPPHEPWPLHEAMLFVAGDGVHGEQDRLSALVLRPHCGHAKMASNHYYVRNGIRVQLPRRQKGVCLLLTPLFSLGAIQSNQPLGFIRTSCAISFRALR